MIFSDFVWVLWFVAAVFFFVIEILTPTFFVICLGFGALAAMIVALIGGGKYFVPQLAAFAVGAFTSILAIRQLSIKRKSGQSVPGTNIHALETEIGIVLRDVGVGVAEGEVRIRGDVWRAISSDGHVHQKDDFVMIDRIDGTLLYVRSFDKDREVAPC